MAHDFQDMDGEPGDFTVSEGHEHPLVTYKQVNNYVIQQSVLMTKWIEEYERRNQLYLHVVELWNRVRKSSRGQRLEKPKDHVAWIHQEVIVRKKSGGSVSEKKMTLQVLH